MGSLLTLGGTVGKSGKVRQTGRSAGNVVLSHERIAGKRALRIIERNANDIRNRLTRDGEHILLRTILPGTPFKPLFAYKALVKMALALMPIQDLNEYGNLLHLLKNSNASVPTGSGTVGMSFGSIGNAPQVVLVSLLKRTDDSLLIPKFMFIVGVGSVCLQLFLWGDDHSKNGLLYGTPGLQFNVVLGDPNIQVSRIAYGQPHDLDWSSAVAQPQPIQEMVLRFHPGTTEGEFFPIWR